MILRLDQPSDAFSVRITCLPIPLVVDTALLDGGRGILSVEELMRLDAFVSDADRQEYLLAHVLLRRVLARETDLPPEALLFQAGPHGKPELGNVLPCVPRFSLTHTRGLVACAVSSVPVGIDAEPAARAVDPKLACRFFAPPEIAWLDHLPDPDRQRGFLRLWTLKEAYVKGIGLGLHQPLDRFWFDLTCPEPSIMLADGSEHETGRWRFLLDESHCTDHILSVAAHVPAAANVRFIIEREDLTG